MKKNGLYSSVVTLKQLKDGFSVPKKTLSGIIRIETEDGISTLFASFINFKTLFSGEYMLFIANSKKQIKDISLSSRPLSLTKTFEDFALSDNEFCAGVCVIENDVPLLIATSRTEGCLVDGLELKKLIYEKYAVLHKNKAKNYIKNLVVNIPNENNDNVDLCEYDDEVVATENYYAKDYDNGVARIKTYESLPNEDVEFNLPNQTQKKESGASDTVNKDEDHSRAKKPFGENLTYYEKNKRELDEVFSRFPKEENLSKIFPCSKWSKVFYEKEKYYVVGLIKEDGQEKYICYGVPDEYSLNPPKELKGYCCFIPLSLFDLTGKGYWMMFQDAVTGASIKSKKG